MESQDASGQSFERACGLIASEVARAGRSPPPLDPSPRLRWWYASRDSMLGHR